MTDDAKKEAWRRRCSQLEALDLDPYDPQVPPDDSRHPQVQAILAGYEVAIGEVIPVTPNWEGHPPLKAITDLGDLAKWLNDQWTSALATETGGEAYKADALEQTARAVRNGFRVLAWLGVEDRPERPLPAETLPVAKHQLDALERWVRQKIKESWIPPEPNQLEDAVVGRVAKQRKRGKFPDEYEVNILIKRFLDHHPRAKIRDVAEAVDLSTGKVSGMDAWKRHMARKKAEKPPPKIKECQLTKEMLAVSGQDDNPAIEKVMKDEAIWRWVVETAKPKEREELHMKTPKEQAELVEMVRKQYDAAHAEPDD